MSCKWARDRHPVPHGRTTMKAADSHACWQVRKQSKVLDSSKWSARSQAVRQAILSETAIKSKHSRASLTNNVMQRRQDEGILLREAFYLRLERCSALPVKAVLQRQNARRCFEPCVAASGPVRAPALQTRAKPRTNSTCRAPRKTDVLAAPTMLSNIFRAQMTTNQT